MLGPKDKYLTPPKSSSSTEGASGGPSSGAFVGCTRTLGCVGVAVTKGASFSVTTLEWTCVLVRVLVRPPSRIVLK